MNEITKRTKNVAKETLGNQDSSDKKVKNLCCGKQACRIRLRLQGSVLKYTLCGKMLKFEKNIRWLEKILKWQ